MNKKQETFLSDGDETDAQCEQLWCDIGIWSSPIFTDNSLDNRAKSFSTMLSSSNMVLYDHPFFLEKYPDGFYTQNAAFIPLPMYERMKELEPLAVKTDSINSYWNLTGLIFIPYLTKMIENKYQISFSEEEKEAILLSATEKSFDKTYDVLGLDQCDGSLQKKDKNLMKELSDSDEEFEYFSSVTKDFIKNTVKEIFNNKEPVFICSEDLALLAEKNEMRSAKAITHWGDDNNFIDYALLKNIDMYEKDHPFSQLMGQVKIPNKTIDLLSLDKENYKQIIRDLPSTQSYVLYNGFESLTYKIVNDSKTKEDLVRNVSGIWTNLAIEANDKEFSALINILRDQCIVKYPSEKDNSLLDREVGSKLAHAINNHELCGPHKRDLLINGITHSASDLSTVRTFMYPKKINKPTMR